MVGALSLAEEAKLIYVLSMNIIGLNFAIKAKDLFVEICLDRWDYL